MSEDKEQEELVQRLLDAHFPDISDQQNQIVDFKETPVAFNKDNRGDDILNDYEFVRVSLRKQVEMMDTASRTALLTAIGSGSARHTEVFAKLMETMANTAERLLKVQKQMNELQGRGAEQPAAPRIGTQNVFFGTTRDLLSKQGSSQDRQPITIDHEPAVTKT